MTHIEKAIREAVEKGYYKGKGAKFNYYEPRFHDFGWYEADGYADNRTIESVFLDPAFWQALGKARGWKERYTSADPEWKTMSFGQMQDNKPTAHWHRFIDHLAEGKDAESFFATL